MSTRADALDAIVCKRDNAEGASLFSTLPKHRDHHLLRLLITYQVMWDFLDSVSERGAHAGHANGRQLHRALVEALDLDAPISDYYRYHPWKDDGGFLLTLVDTCRCMCAQLPSYRQIRGLMLDGVERCAIQSLNHEPDPHKRDAGLRQWAERECYDDHGLDWFELTAAASAFMPHALLALAAEPFCEEYELVAVNSTYFPWISLAIAMLDSYVDQVEDRVNDGHSYISHYAGEMVALDRIATIIRQAITRTARLPSGRRHTVIAASMVAMYLSKKSANTPRLRVQTRALVRAGGLLTVLLLPAAYLWRTARIRTLASQVANTDLPSGLCWPPVIQTFFFWRSPFLYYKHCHRYYGSRFVLRAMNHPPMVFFADPDDVKAIMAASPEILHPGEGGQMIAPIVGTSSFMLLDEDEHLLGRRAVLPALQKRAIEQDADRLIDVVRRAIALWPRDVPLQLHPHLRALTLEVVLRRIFSDGAHKSEITLPLLLNRVLAMLAVTGNVVLPLPSLRRGPGRTVWNRFLRNRQEVDLLINGLVRERCAESERRHDDVLATLLGSRNTDGSLLSQQQLRDNVMTLLVSGHETTAAQLAWAFQLLAHNPTTQERLIEEVDEGSSDTYLTATIQEVLRHRTVFPLTVPRVVKQPIEIGGWTYHPPAHLLGCIYLLHHNPDIYPEPDEFRPERFLEGQPSPYTYLPWGGGRRRCPGSHLALLEMKTVLRAVLETMMVSPASRRMERPKWRSVMVTPHAGSRVVLHRRERRPTAVRRFRQTSVGACPAPIRTADLAKHRT